MRTSALRRWLREERARENVEALVAGVDIGGDFGPGRPLVVGDWDADLAGAFHFDRYGAPGPLFAEACAIAESYDDAEMEYLRHLSERAGLDPSSIWRSGGDPEPGRK